MPRRADTEERGVPSPRSSASTAASPAPAARRAAAHEPLDATVSASITPPPCADSCSSRSRSAGSCTRASSSRPASRGSSTSGIVDARTIDAVGDRPQPRDPLRMTRPGVVCEVWSSVASSNTEPRVPTAPHVSCGAGNRGPSGPARTRQSGRAGYRPPGRPPAFQVRSHVVAERITGGRARRPLLRLGSRDSVAWPRRRRSPRPGRACPDRSRGHRQLPRLRCAAVRLPRRRHERGRAGRRAALRRCRLRRPRAAPPPRARSATTCLPARPEPADPPRLAQRPRRACSRLDDLAFDSFWRLERRRSPRGTPRDALGPLPGRRGRRIAGRARRVRDHRARRAPGLPAARRRPSRRPPPRLGTRPRRRRAALAPTSRCPPCAREHAVDQRRRARAVRVVRIPAPAGRALRARPDPLRRCDAIARSRSRSVAMATPHVARRRLAPRRRRRPAPSAAGAAPSPGARRSSSQDAWTPIGGDLHLRVRIPDALARRPTRPQPRRVPAGHRPRHVRPRPPRTRAPARCSTRSSSRSRALPAGTGDARSVTVGIEANGAPRDPDRLSLRRTGVYPLAVEVLDGDRALPAARFVTMVVAVTADIDRRSPSRSATRLGVAWTWPLSAGPSTLPNGSTDPEGDARPAPDGPARPPGRRAHTRGRRAAHARPGPRDARGMGAPRCRRSRRSHTAQPRSRTRPGATRSSPGTYVPTNLPSLLAVGLDQRRRRAARPRRRDPRPHPRRHAPTSAPRSRMPVDASSLARLRAGGVDRVVVDGDVARCQQPRDPDAARSCSRPPPSLVPSGSVAAVAGDAAIERAAPRPTARPRCARSGSSPRSRSSRSRSRSATRAITIVNPADLDPPIDAARRAADRSAGQPAARADDRRRGVRARRPRRRRRTARRSTRAARARTRHRLRRSARPSPTATAGCGSTAFRSLAGPTDPVVLRGERLAPRVPVGDVRRRAGHRSRAATRRERRHRASTRSSREIRIPRPSTITLTSRSGEIPLTFRNDTGQPVDVYLELAEREAHVPRGLRHGRSGSPTKSTTVRVPVEARTSGTFPLHLTVTSADGALSVANSTFRVRSTAVQHRRHRADGRGRGVPRRLVGSCTSGGTAARGGLA